LQINLQKKRKKVIIPKKGKSDNKSKN